MDDVFGSQRERERASTVATFLRPGLYWRRFDPTDVNFAFWSLARSVLEREIHVKRDLADSYFIPGQCN